MNETSQMPKCPNCGAPVAADAPEGLCPRCLVRLNFATQTEFPGDAAGPHGTGISKPPPPAPAEISTLFPQLEILECLGRGGMGAVYKARQPKLDRWVALKILAPERQADAQFRERFEREARTLARLNHPNIVAVYDVGEANGYCYLLMEYVDGVTLRQLMQGRKLSPEEALGIVPKVCEALEFAHGKGVVHRDIKPENILLDRAGQVKIADFGIAKILEPGLQDFSLTGAKDVIGTPHYMAPEQVEQPTKVDHRADIFSLGVVFYEMLTGELPLGKFQAPSHRVQVDVRLDEIVLHALEKEPERRYQHASEVRTAVETVASTPNPTNAGSGLRVEKTNWISAARWTARIFSTLLLGFYGVFILAEGLPPIGSQPEGVQFNFIALGLMLLGFIVGWSREGAAALLIASGWTIWQVSENAVRWNLFQTPLLVAVLYGFCWWAARGRRTGVVAAVVVIMALALGAGRAFVPTSIFVRGVVRDARSGKVVPDAELRLPSRIVRSAGEVSAPNARAGRDGRFTLYVGWLSDQTRVTITAPGYQTLTTGFGPRPPRRNMLRDFQLQPEAGSVPPQAPPVVVNTFPESGATGVDPALTELRVTFSKPMRSDSFAWVMWTKDYPVATGPARFLEDGRTSVLPVKLEPGRVYGIWLNSEASSGFKDAEGKPAVPYLLIFETRK